MVNFIFWGPPIQGGMAGSKRLFNIWNELPKFGIHRISYSSKNPREFQAEIITDRIFCKSLNLLIYILKNQIYGPKTFIYHYGYLSLSSSLWMLVFKIFGIRIVIDIVEDVFVKEHYSTFLNKLNHLFRRFLNVRFFRIIDFIVVISDHLFKLCSDLSKRDNIFLLPISVNTANFLAPDLKITETEENKVALFYGGSFAEKDGIELLMDAIKELGFRFPGKFKLILTGRIDRRRQSYVKSLLKDSSKFVEINFLGFLSDEEYYSVLKSCDIMLMLRNNSSFARTGFPFKLGEMLATGKPVIVTSIEGVTNFLENKKNALIIEPENKMELVAAIIDLTFNSELADYIGIHGRQISFAQFDAAQHTRRLMRFLNIEINDLG